MSILNKLALKELKLNKRRTITTIIGIMLSSALVCAVAGMITSFQQTLVNSAIAYDGNYHAGYSSVKYEDYKALDVKGIRLSFVTQELGCAKAEKMASTGRYIYVNEYDAVALKNYGINLLEGELPSNSNELIISNEFNETSGKKYKVGDKVTLTFGNRYFKGEQVSDHEYFQYDYTTPELTEVDKETFIPKNSKEYTIVGIMDYMSYSITGNYAAGPLVISKIDEYKSVVNVYTLFSNPSQYKELSYEVGEALNASEQSINFELLGWQGGSLSKTSSTLLYTVGGIVIGIIIISSVFVIRNSFSISVVEKHKQYGMLASIGATPKQIRHSVLFEALTIGLIAIPLGILCGIIAIFVLVLLINAILGDFLGTINFVYYLPVMPIIVTVIATLVTIILSALIPAIIASHTSPIDALRNTKDIKIKSKKLKTPSIIKKIFGVGGDLAYKNLNRSKKKYRTTVVSLVVSIVIFISLSTFIHYGFKIGFIYYQDLNYNVSVQVYNTNSEDDRLEAINKIIKLNNIKYYSLMREISLDIPLELLTPDANSVTYGGSTRSVNIISVGREEYERFVKRVGGSISDYKDGAILIDKTYANINGVYTEINYLNIDEGEMLKGTSGYYDSEVEQFIESNFEIKIIKRTDEVPMGINLSSEYGAAYLIVSDEYMDNLVINNHINTIYIDSDNSKQLCKDIDEIEISSGNIEYTNVDEIAKMIDAMILVISIFLYGFIAVITLIGVTNIFNTITTNMFLRSKEFAILKSTGMTDKEFNRMINLESVLYGLKSLVIGIPIGIALSHLIYTAFTGRLQVPYVLPMSAILISIIFVFIIVYITMRFSMKKINKQNIIETIRNDNI